MRLRILELAHPRQYCVRSLARMLGISEPAVSQHLRVMREAGLVNVEKLGYHSHYRLVPEALEQLGEQFMQLAEAARKAPMEETGHGCGRRHMLAAEMGEPGFRKRCHGHGRRSIALTGSAVVMGMARRNIAPTGSAAVTDMSRRSTVPMGSVGVRRSRRAVLAPKPVNAIPTRRWKNEAPGRTVLGLLPDRGTDLRRRLCHDRPARP